MTSRLSYTSSPESDGEFCDSLEPGSRTLGRQKTDPKLSLQLMDQPGRLARSNSDPSLARQEGVIGDPEKIEETPNKSAKRRSQGGDSKYGFSGDKENESVDDLPLPPHPQHQQTSPRHHKTSNRYSAHFPPDQDQIDGGQPNLPKVPPKIDRQKKPSRRTSERLFGNGEVSGNYMNSDSGPRSLHSSSLDRHSHIRDMKLVSCYFKQNSYNTCPFRNIMWFPKSYQFKFPAIFSLY